MKDWEDEDWEDESEEKEQTKEEGDGSDEEYEYDPEDGLEDLTEEERAELRPKKRKSDGINRGVNREPLFKGEGKIIPKYTKDRAIESLELDCSGKRYRIHQNQMGIALQKCLFQEFYITGKLVTEDGVPTIYVHSYV